MTLRLYDTARRAVVPFDPGPVVTMYVCGITPYDSTHLGHAFTYLTHDLVIRRLEDLGHEVRMVRNFTDVDDPLFEKAAGMGVDAAELAEAEIARFRSDMAALGTRPAMAEPLVSTSIADIVELIAELETRGHTYTVEGTTWFAVDGFEGFGSLSGLDVDQMVELARERGGTPDDPRQRNPLDFVLWQPSAQGEPAWESPWGPGRPGWHIECSAMVRASLGDTIDLHGGGADLIFPHHECEIAQMVPVTGRPFARHWLHVGMVAYQGDKMSKSLGNLVFVSELLKEADPRAIRLALLRHHYRSGFEWHHSELGAAEADLARLDAGLAAGRGPNPGGVAAEVTARIDDDLDTPAALDRVLDFADACAAGSGQSPEAPAVLAHLAGLLGIGSQGR